MIPFQSKGHPLMHHFFPPWRASPTHCFLSSFVKTSSCPYECLWLATMFTGIHARGREWRRHCFAFLSSLMGNIKWQWILLVLPFKIPRIRPQVSTSTAITWSKAHLSSLSSFAVTAWAIPGLDKPSCTWNGISDVPSSPSCETGGVNEQALD